ncbi:beta-1,6-N-acetylglucosaminyltransferase [Emcibacter sp. SYSU 3D8]|uniref:beta-1,6-N-acetylglucosaminyltransferase n=1 Tax=Emcibacter sp. SYSU 3D8 TaxID=3133969 RepID=UPI0031FF2C67
MTLVYLIRAHRAPHQLARLVGALRGEGVRFFIHIDRKVDEAPFRRALAAPDVRFVANRVVANWGGYSLVRATLAGLREIFADPSGAAPDRICLLSGQDYPLISSEGIAAYFRRHADTEFISYARMPTPFWAPIEMRRIERYNFYDWIPLVWPANKSRRITRHMTFRLRLFTKLVHVLLPKPAFPAGYIPYGGSAWWCLTGQTARRLLELTDANPALARFYERTIHAEEMYFQTLLVNSGADPARIRGEWRENTLGSYLWFEIWKKSSPRTLLETDLDALLASNRMFARKFDIDVDSRILDLLDEARTGRTLP